MPVCLHNPPTAAGPASARLPAPDEPARDAAPRSRRHLRAAPLLAALALGLAPGGSHKARAALDPATIRVQPAGADTRSTADAPPSTLGAALEVSRKLGPRPRRILLAPGVYHLERTVCLDARDSGLTIEGAGAGKTIIHGGTPLAGWRGNGDGLWIADAPATRSGAWDFRALVVNGALRPRARIPRTGRLEHECSFPARWMSSAGGGWERKPTAAELTTLRYKPGDLGPWLDARNAEVTIYHMWDESTVGLAAHDPTSRTLTFAAPAAHPPGAFGVKTYAIWNVREGLTDPGRWCLDRVAGVVLYRPMPGEEMARTIAVAPRVETILEIRGARGAPARDIALRRFTLSTTNTPPRPGGFGAGAYRAALEIAGADKITIEQIEIANTAGHALHASNTRALAVRDCELHHLGAGGCRVGEGDARIEGNRIHHVGEIYPSAIGLSARARDGASLVIRRNEIHHTPYSGMSVGGTGALIEENVLHHCMQELHDGAAIYVSGARDAIVRRNTARDIVAAGSGYGYGVSAYYLDEKCRGCTVEHNSSSGIRRPAHNHMTLDCALRDNEFSCEGDMELSFARSAGVRVTGNTLRFAGELKINDPDAVAEWTGNRILRPGAPPVADAPMPRAPRPRREGPVHATAAPMPRPPALDGRLDGDAWPPGGISLGELPDQRRARGAPITAKLCADRTHLHVAVTIVAMFPEQRKLGRSWESDEAVELALGGTRTDGTPLTHVLRGFADGSFQCLSAGGATRVEADALARAARHAAAVEKNVWRSEWSIPLAALGVRSGPKTALPLNVTVHRTEDRQLIQWAGTLGRTWDLERGGRLLLGEIAGDRSARRASRSSPAPSTPLTGAWHKRPHN